MRCRTLISNRTKYTAFSNNSLVLRGVFCLLATVLALPAYAPAGENGADNTLIVYYSRTGKSRLLCDALQQQINGDLLEVKPLDEDRYRPGRIGYYTAAFDSVFNRYIPIVPEELDVSSYTSIVIVSPVWNWKLSAPIRTLIHNNQEAFDGKSVVFVTSANEEVTKYEVYGDDASFLKRYLRDFLRDKCAAMKSFVESSGCTVAGYHHIATQEKTDEQIMAAITSLIPEIQRELSGGMQLARIIE